MAVLYVTEPYATLKKDGDTLVIHIPASEKGGTARKVTVPLIKVEEVVIIGDSTLTPQALAALLEQRVVISFLTAFGQFRGRVEPGERKNSPLRLAQVRVHDDARRSFALAKQFVIGKIHNA
ncbi:MAG: CRISPR-associated endonuclease Cas1, partial [Anaerolineales bacterium]